MRKLALTLLTGFLLLLASPLAFADGIEAKMCPFNITYSENTDDGNDNETKTHYQTELDAFEEDLANSSTSCGSGNTVLGGTLNLGDCAAEGKVVTEITEVIAGDVSLDDAEIKTVYKGVCCFYGEDADSCEQERVFHTEKLSECSAYYSACQKVQWIISSSGAGIIKVYVKMLYTWGASIIGFIAVVVIVVSGIQISASGVSGDISQAKTRIIQSISGLVLLFLSGLILYTINPGFFS